MLDASEAAVAAESWRERVSADDFRELRSAFPDAAEAPESWRERASVPVCLEVEALARC